MPQPTAWVKLALLSFASWACTVLLYAAGIAITAASLERAQTSTAETAALALIAAEILVAGVSVAFVFFRSKSYFRAAAHLVWAAVFALLQLGACAVAVFASLLVLNR
jgi:hypothetical protein